ncbi:MAG: T9SS type A sorting domain-containing protein [Bacteroidota bacterium]
MIRLVAATLLTLAALALLGNAQAQTLDRTYGTDGYAALDLEASAVAVTDLVLDPKDRALIATRLGASGATLARSAPDGTADAEFGTDGQRTIPNAVINGLHVLSDETIYASGRRDGGALLVRMSEDGTTTGQWRYLFDAPAEAVSVTQPREGVIAMAVRLQTASGPRCGVLVVDEDGGRIDAFGEEGLVTVPGAADCDPATVLAFGDRIVLVGSSGNEEERLVLAAAFGADGRPDMAFGTEGVALGGFPDEAQIARDAVVTPEGDLLVAGEHEKSVFGVLLVRFQSNGAPALTGSNGVMWVPHPTPSLALESGALAVALDARGQAFVPTTSADRTALGKFDERGELATPFGTTGFARFEPREGMASAGHEVGFDQFGRLYLAGMSEMEDGTEAAFVARIIGAQVVSNETAPETGTLALAPNPTRGAVSLTLPQRGTVTVFDALGREVLRQDAPAGRLGLSTDRLAPGVYSVIATTEDQRHVARLTVVR